MRLHSLFALFLALVLAPAPLLAQTAGRRRAAAKAEAHQ